MKIGLVGKMASGKSELSNWFLSVYGGKRVAFADQLKEDVIKFGLTPDGQIIKSRDRQILQNYGQYRRGEIEQFEFHNGTAESFSVQFHSNPNVPEQRMAFLNFGDREQIVGMCEPNHWVSIAMQKAKQLEESGENVIMDDIRRDNENDALRNNGFTIIRVTASDDIRKQRLIARDGNFKEEALHDISETQVDSLPYDYEIVNEGSFEEAAEQLRLIVAKINS